MATGLPSLCDDAEIWCTAHHHGVHDRTTVAPHSQLVIALHETTVIDIDTD